MTEEEEPWFDWRVRCPKCGRFLSGKSFLGTAYTPFGSNAEYDAYTDFYQCPKDGEIEGQLAPRQVPKPAWLIEEEKKWAALNI